MTLSRWVSEWIISRAGQLAPRTVECYTYQLQRHITPAIGDRKLNKLKPKHIVAMLSNLVADGHTRTAELCYAVLSAALRAAVKHGKLEASPLASIPRPRHQRANARWWSHDELRRFVAATQDSPYAIAWQLALTCGLRRGELAGLRWEDVDFDRGLLHIRNQRVCVKGRGVIDAPPKSTAGRRDIAAPSAILDALNTHRVLQSADNVLHSRPDCPYVVTGAKGACVSPHTLNKAFSVALAASGVRPINLHGLRHTMATLAVTCGVDMRVLQSILGHSTYTLTANTYAHVPTTSLRAAMDTIADQVL